MTGRRMTRLAAKDLRRHWRHFTAAAVGIVLGVAVLTFCVALGLQLRALVLERAMPARTLEVTPRTAEVDLFALRVGLGRDTIAPETLRALAGIDGVVAVHPRLRLLVPAVASGGAAILGAGLQTELVADGIEPSPVRDELGPAFREVSRSYQSGPCTEDAECVSDGYCAPVGATGGICRPYLPAVVSPYVIDVYNSGLRRVYRLPRINPDALTGLTFDIVFGDSSFRRSSLTPVSERVRLVGVSRWALPLGLTLPLAEVERVNRLVLGEEAGGGFHAAVLRVGAEAALPEVIRAVEAAGLDVSDREARRAAQTIGLVTLALALGGVVLVVVSSAHVMHVFSLILMVRRRELGLLRAVGARRADIRSLLALEAGAVGLVSGILGVAGARAGAALLDGAAARWLGALSLDADSLFAFGPWVAVVPLLAAACCVAAAVGPARRAGAEDPAAALGGH